MVREDIIEVVLTAFRRDEAFRAVQLEGDETYVVDVVFDNVSGGEGLVLLVLRKDQGVVACMLFVRLAAGEEQCYVVDPARIVEVVLSSPVRVGVEGKWFIKQLLNVNNDRQLFKSGKKWVEEYGGTNVQYADWPGDGSCRLLAANEGDGLVLFSMSQAAPEELVALRVQDPCAERQRTVRGSQEVSLPGLRREAVGRRTDESTDGKEHRSRRTADVRGGVMMHKGRSRLSIKVCACGRLALRCKFINGKNTHCKNRPRLCGYCVIHCERKRKRNGYIRPYWTRNEPDVQVRL